MEADDRKVLEATSPGPCGLDADKDIQGMIVNGLDYDETSFDAVLG